MPQDVAYFEQLVRGIERVQMLADDLHRLDVRTTANDDNYFVFEDVVCSSLRMFLIVCFVLALFAQWVSCVLYVAGFFPVAVISLLLCL